jgi:hypothetical protein
MKMTEVKLSYAEILQGAMVGVMRQVQNLKAGRTHRHGGSANNGWQMNIEGALGEMALAKHLDVYIGGTGVIRGPDVGECDVRTTSGANNRLILHPDDPDDRVFWLLTGANGQYQVRGNILGAEGKQQKWWKDPVGGRPAYFVPQGELNDG